MGKRPRGPVRASDRQQADRIEVKRWGDALRKARLKRGLTAREIGNRVGAAKSDVEAWEHGYAYPTRPQLARLYNMCFHYLESWEFLLPVDVRNPAEARARAPQPSTRRQTADSPQLRAPLRELAKVKAKPAKPPPWPDALRVAREAHKLTAQELAELVEVTASAIKHWENGRGLPAIENFNRLSKLLPELAQSKPRGMRHLRAAAEPAPVVPIRSVSPPPPAPAPPPAESLAELGAEYGRAIGEVQEARDKYNAALSEMDRLVREQGQKVAELEKKIKAAETRSNELQAKLRAAAGGAAS